MHCDDIRIAISARLDGEDPGIAAADVEAHLAACAACGEYARAAEGLHRRLRLAPAADVPDLSGPILASIAPDDVAPGQAGLRLALVIVGVVQAAAALPALVLGEGTGLSAHGARHLGSFALALAVGFLYAAWRPTRAGGVLAVVGVLAACVALTSSVDVLAGRADATTELGAHVTELVGVVVLGLLARPALRRPRARLAG